MRSVMPIIFALVLTSSLVALAQETGLQVREEDGGSVVVRSASGLLNQGSSLKRRWLAIDDASSPVRLNKAGLYPRFDEKEQLHVLMPVGTASVTRAISAVELRYMLFDVWGHHLSTLTMTRLVDTSTSFDLREGAGWPAWENEVAQMVSVVAFVARVKTADGQVWTCDTERIASEIGSLGLVVTPPDFIPDQLRALDPQSIYWDYRNAVQRTPAKAGSAH